jgi:hypothetical protein
VNYDIPWEIEVYYLPALLAMAIWAGHGLDRLGAFCERGRLSLLSPALALCVPLGALISNFSTCDLSEQTFVLDHARDVAGVMEPDASIILPETNPTFALIYLRHVEHKATGLAMWSGVDAKVIPVEKAIQPAHEQKAIPETLFVHRALTKGTPVYCVDRRAESALSGFAQIPWGCLYRIVRTDESAEWMERARDPASYEFRFNPDEQRLEYGSEQRLIVCRTLLVRADYAWEHGDREHADHIYTRVRELGSGLPSIPGRIGMRYAEQGRPEKAVEIYESALREGEDAALRNRLGALYGRLGKLAAAENEFVAALHRKPGFAEAYANLASVYGRRGEIDKAVEQLELALEHDPHHVRALRNLAIARMNSGRKDDARTLLERALAVNPAQEDIRELLDTMR